MKDRLFDLAHGTQQAGVIACGDFGRVLRVCHEPLVAFFQDALGPVGQRVAVALWYSMPFST